MRMESIVEDDNRCPLAPQVEWLTKKHVETEEKIERIKEAQHTTADVLLNGFRIRPGTEREDAIAYMLQISSNNEVLSSMRDLMKKTLYGVWVIGITMVVTFLLRQMGAKDIIGDIGVIGQLLH